MKSSSSFSRYHHHHHFRNLGSHFSSCFTTNKAFHTLIPIQRFRTGNIVRQLFAGLRKKVAGNSATEGWYGPHMAAASRAIADRIPLADFILEVRDARIPLSSEYEQLRNWPSSLRRIIVLNKMDLANRSQKKEWMRYFEQESCIAYGVNSHNKENIKEFLNFLQAQTRELRKTDHSSHTTTVLLVGIPNVGKSALANSLHQIGRISAAEKGKLKHATISPLPGETKDITSLKIASHPNIYVLDTPSVLPPQILDNEAFAKLALTGAIRDAVVGEKELAQVFLAILNLSDEYKKWAKLSTNENGRDMNCKTKCSGGSEFETKQKRQYPTDHTQDFMVNDVRRTLFETVSSFDGNLEDGNDLARLIETQFIALRDAFRLYEESDEENSHNKVAAKLLNLYRTGRLGHYTLDIIPCSL